VSGRAIRWLLSLAHRAAVQEPGGARGRLTIIRHHRVYAPGAWPLYRLGVSQPVLAAQLELLRELGLAPVTVAEGWRRLREGEPGSWVALTFDDGYGDNVERALPLLEATGAKATFYLTAGLIERRRAPWWDSLAHALEHTRRDLLEWTVGERHLTLPLRTRPERASALLRLVPELRVHPVERDRRLAEIGGRLEVGEAPCELAPWESAADLVRAGMEVGAHTLDHPFLSLLPPAEQRREVAGSVELIERRLGVRPTGLAYPGGDHDARTLEIVAASGLDYAVTTRPGVNRRGDRPFELRRRGLSEGACLGPSGRFSRRLAIAELDGAFDRMRGVEVGT